MTMTSPIRLTLYYDGLCPLCSREIAFLRRRNRAGTLGFVDFTAAEFDPAPLGLTRAELESAMHASDDTGQIHRGVEVFRRAYTLVGLGWLVAWTRLPVIRPLVDLAYRGFARIRPRLQPRTACATGHCRR